MTLAASAYSQVVLASAARTAAIQQAMSNLGDYRGGHLVINVTSIGTATLTPTIQGYDAATDSWYNILVGLPITTNGVTVLKVYPGIGVLANGAVSDVLPYYWRLSMAVANANSATYSVSFNPVR